MEVVYLACHLFAVNQQVFADLIPNALVRQAAISLSKCDSYITLLYHWPAVGQKQDFVQLRQNLQKVMTRHCICLLI
jgi:hypothetical protein